MVHIYVGNLDRRLTEDNIRSTFEVYGAVCRVTRAFDFAVVEMIDDQQARKAASEMNNDTSWVLRVGEVA